MKLKTIQQDSKCIVLLENAFFCRRFLLGNRQLQLDDRTDKKIKHNIKGRYMLFLYVKN